ncbi:hypothetical protein EV643_1398 [Kribbella sp. VKM Ac-2527]|uniref:TrbL/VirB6 plasmid conjugal transfer protein n=1 Tax=Kribbella caucasensis TaxID=2512215 RepID=A0A4R6J4B7_9ACTN|nr:hypothetical protein [Kribbella sp. VKM Ac-2527]TDO30209.1 hypothetical protein EV643_1398 [Kribbella sp. VKM Ac-2527]
MAWTDCLLNPVSCVASSVGDTAANSAWESFLRWSATGLADLSATVFNAFSTSTAPRFDEEWWRDNLDLMVTVSLPVLVAVVVLQCMSAVVRREPARLAQALLGALIGTAGVPMAVGITATCGTAVDEISTAVLGTSATAEGLKRMTDISALLAAGTLGGFLLLAVLLALLALFSLYFVMLVREVALVAFVVFAPIAMASWTWSATRHWLRRWVEVVGALLFSKVAMAVIFTLGLSATGAGGQGNASNLGTFLAGVLLVAMAAFAPFATFSFIHWAGDQGHAMTHALQQGTSGAVAARDQVEQAQQWRADHFGGSDDEDPMVDGDSDTDPGLNDSGDLDDADSTTDSASSGDSTVESSTGRSSYDDTPASSQPAQPPAAGSGSDSSSAVAIASSHASVDASSPGGQNPDSSPDNGSDSTQEDHR